MIAIQKEIRHCHRVKDLTSPYTVEPWVMDTNLNKWVVTVAHPQFGSIECYEDSVVVEENVGRNVILIAYLPDRFMATHNVIITEEEEQEFI